MIRVAFLLALLLGLAAPAGAERVVADLSQSRVSITAGFSGSQILVFGALRHDPSDPPVSYPILHPLEVIVTVSGPLEPVTVRKKARRAGIWINADSFEINAAPTLYKVASTRPLDEILSETEDQHYRISVPLAIRSAGTADSLAGSDSSAGEFVEALIRVRQRDGLYEETPDSVRLTEQVLFRTDVNLPANLVEGAYTARIFLLRNKQVVAEYSRIIDVRKVGIERWIYTLAQDHALIYGLLSLAIAIAAGWAASAVFRYIRG